MDDPGPRHPPARQRVRLILTELDRLGWSDAMRAGDAELDSWIRGLSADGPSYVGVEGFLTWAVEDLSAVIRRVVKRRLGNRVFTPQAAQLIEVDRMLAAGIPPAQRLSGDAVSRESIILACWHAALASAGHGPSALPDAPDAPELAELLPAALELSALSSAWSA